MKTTLPQPPRHLTAKTREWWRHVIKTYELEQHHLRLLTQACEAWDRAQQAREQIAKDGAFFNNRFGEPKVHPALAVERDNRIVFARLIRELDLDAEPPQSSRPPAIKSNRG